MFNIKLELKIAKRKKTSSAKKRAVRLFFFIMLGDMELVSQSFTIEFTNDKLSNKTEFF